MLKRADFIFLTVSAGLRNSFTGPKCPETSGGSRSSRASAQLGTLLGIRFLLLEGGALSSVRKCWQSCEWNFFSHPAPLAAPARCWACRSASSPLPRSRESLSVLWSALAFTPCLKWVAGEVSVIGESCSQGVSPTRGALPQSSFFSPSMAFHSDQLSPQSS